MADLTQTFHKTQFLISAQNVEQCPDDTGYEVAFAGRSNAGKSSAINTLTQQKKLARTSKTPGRTQLLNFFNLSDDRRIVDLPGYGYANVSNKMRDEWQKNIDAYLRSRRSLAGLVLVMDVRHPLQAFDTMMLEWGSQCDMPMHILLTKADKLGRGPAKNTLFKVRGEVKQFGDAHSVQLFSSLKKGGIKELADKLGGWLSL